jgi:hypothetical protein
MTEEPKEIAKETIKRDRSPKFPYIGLGKAVERIEVLYAKAKRYDARVSDIAKDWDLSAKSSSIDRTVAAIQSFGLIEDSGSGENRKIKLSELGARILIDARPGIRESLLADVALKPPILAEYAHKWADGRPDEAHALSQLQLDGGFTSEAAKIFLRVFDETIRFVSARQYDKKSDSELSESLPKPRQQQELEIGDLVQVEINGGLTLEQPARLRAVETLDGRKWAFVVGSETGIPMEQIVLHAKGPPPLAAGASPPTLAEPSMFAAKIVSEKGEREWLRGPLSKEVGYRLIVNGDLGPREIGKLIKLLEAQKAVLSDDDDEG